MAITTTDQKYKTITPYDLSANDNPGAIISQPLLNGSNYDEWAMNIRIALRSRKKFEFLDGSIPKPGTDSAYLEDWIANNHLLVGWIKQTIEPKIRSSISTREVAKDLWDIIKKRFSQKSGARLQQLRNQLVTCKQNGSLVDDYFGRLTKLWDGISECMNSKRCSCNKCECDLNTAHDKEKETLQIHDFLSGLDDSAHSVIRSQLCAITPLPDLDSVYQTIVQNETIKQNAVKEVLVMSFASQANSNPFSKGGTVHTRDVSRQSENQTYHTGQGIRDGSRHCTVCGRTGHEAATCYKVVGYPEWWGDRSRNRGNNKSTASGRGRGSHTRANSTQIGSANSAAVSANVSLTDSNRQGLSGLTDEQWTAVQHLLMAGKSTPQLSGKRNENVWILDTGATHHMNGCLDLLDEIRDISPISVSLPAGSDVTTRKQGTIHLTSLLSLKNVYHVNGFYMNLISLGQLVTENYLIGQVTDKLIILQDRRTRMLIGAGERERERDCTGFMGSRH